MNFEIFNLKNIEFELQYKIAKQIENYTNGKTGEQPQMLPVSCEEIFNKYLGLVAIKEKEFAGYISSNNPIEWKGNLMAEVGTLWVPKEHSKQGIGHALVEKCTESLNGLDILPFAFCNNKSLPIFKDKDYKEDSEVSIPESAYSLCLSCPTKPKTGCCDTVVVWEGQE